MDRNIYKTETVYYFRRLRKMDSITQVRIKKKIEQRSESYFDIFNKLILKKHFS